MNNITKVAVIGAGTMGGQIAAHLANAGISTILLDIVLPDQEDRNFLAKKTLQTLTKSSTIMTKELAQLITPGNLEDDLQLLEEVDLVIEAVLEKIPVKEEIFTKIESSLKEECIIATNTSGLSITEISETVSETRRKKFIGIHFFNPPRYMHLVELIPTKYTAQSVITTTKDFLENQLGKGVVVAKDTPNFIANRIGIVTALGIMRDAQETSWLPKDIDSLMGTFIGRASSGAYALGDLVGIDIVHAVAQTGQTVASEKGYFEEPAYMKQLLDQGMLGRKTNQGFYKRTKTEDLQLNLKTMTYMPKKVSKEIAEYIEKNKKLSVDMKMKEIMSSNDPISQFIWKNIADNFSFSANSVPDNCTDYKEIDHAMKWGFNWLLGPFELWNVIGMQTVYYRLKKEGYTLPKWIDEMIDKEQSFYEKETGKKEKLEMIDQQKEWSLEKNNSDILTFTIKSKNSVISTSVTEGLGRALDELEQTEAIGMVIESSGMHFSLGANLVEIQQLISNEKYDALEKQVKLLEETNQRLKYSSKPVVTLVKGMALGGGCEIVLHSPFVIADPETYLGLVEAGVGLIPGGGGTKELATRALERNKFTKTHRDFTDIKAAVYQIGQGKISKNAFNAKEMGLLKESDTVLFNSSKMKQVAYEIIELKQSENYTAPVQTNVTMPGESAYYHMMMEVKAMHDGQFISDYDELMLSKLISVMTGKEASALTAVSEKELLTAERKTFVDLAKNKQTHERIDHMLKTGKPLRN